MKWNYKYNVNCFYLVSDNLFTQELALSVSRNLEKDLAGRLKTDPYTVRKSAL